MLKKLFGLDKKERKEVEGPVKNGIDELFSPLTGKIVPLSDVPDPTFSERMMGDGLAVEPTESIVVSPVDGEILQVFPTKHAIGIRTINDVEVLIHIGIDTVNMKGEGFNTYVKGGDHVRKGDKLVEFDLSLVKEKASSTITPIIITNGDAIKTMEKIENIEAVAGETKVMTIKS